VIPMHELGYFSVFGILYAMIFSLLAVLALIKVLPTTRFVIAT
jgi:predicted RND superfamily exporter protein